MKLPALASGAVAIALFALGTLAPFSAAQDATQPTLEELFATLRSTPDGEVVRRVELAERALELTLDPPDLGGELEARFHLGLATLDLRRYGEAREHLERAILLARYAKSDAWLMQSLGNLAVAENLQGNLDEAIVLAEEGLALGRAAGRTTLVAQLLNVLATAHERRGEFEEALAYYSEALPLSIQQGDLQTGASIANNVGVLHLNLENYGEALAFFEETADAWRTIGNDEGVAAALANIADVHYYRGEYEQALEGHRLVLALREECCPEASVALSHQALGNVYLALGRNEEALEHLERALGIQRRLGLGPEVVAALGMLARTYAALDRSEEALVAAQEGLDLSRVLEVKGQRVGVLEALVEAHRAGGNFELALMVREEAIELERDLKRLETRRAAAVFRDQLETTLKEHEIEALEKDNALQALALEKQRLLRDSLLVGTGLLLFVALLGWALFLSRRRALVRVRERERRYEALADLSPVGIFRAESGGRLLYVSRNWVAIAGHSAADAVGDAWLDLVHPDERATAISAWWACVGEGAPFECELRLLRPDGTVRRVLAQAAPEADVTGGVPSFVGTITDVTVQHELEEEVRRAQKLGSLGLLAGGIAHDFNNILTSILGHVSFARSKSDPRSNNMSHLDSIDAAAQRASELCRQLLAYAGRGRFVVKTMDLNPAVRDTVDLLELAVPKKVRLELSLSTQPAVVDADVTQLRQVLLNLVTNAVEAMGGRAGEIVVGTSLQARVEGAFDQSFLAEDERPGGFVALSVADKGCGLSDEARDRIFDPFFTTKETGHGLGMTGVLGILRNHGGAIRIETTLGEGTRVTIVLPASSSAPEIAAPSSLDEEADRHRGALVLVAEDEPALQRIVSESLQRAGFEVLVAEDGAEALALYEANRERIAIAVLDMIMPVKDGAEVFAYLRKRDEELPVLFTSGYTSEESARQMRSVGSPAFLAKPYRPCELVGAVNACLDQGVVTGTEPD